MLSIKIDDKEYELSCTFGIILAVEKYLKTNIVNYVCGDKGFRSGMPLIDIFNVINLATDNQISKDILEKYIFENYVIALKACMNFFNMYIVPEETKKNLDEEDSKKNDLATDPA